MTQDSAGAPDTRALERRFHDREACIGVIGLGYVGLPLALAACDAGFRVLGFDTDPPKVTSLNAGRSYIGSIPDAGIARHVASGRLEATSDHGRAGEPDAILICVPTPLGPDLEPDLSFVEGTVRAIAPHLRPGQLVSLESTTWPGTTREVVRPIIEEAGHRAGHDVFLAYSPEREDPGNPDYSSATIPKVVGGDGDAALRLALALYGAFVVRTVPVSSLETAEAVKLTENVFRAVNIALVNELKTIYARLGIDIFEVVDAAATKPFGFMPFRPGPGLGGHCIPIDPFYLAWRARRAGVPARFVELAGEVNRAMPAYVLDRLTEALADRFGRRLAESRILVVGIAYKKNVEDVRESPGLAIIEMLEERGAEVAYHDPHVAEIPPTREHGRLAGRRSVELAPGPLEGFDAVLIVTDHNAVDWPALVAAARLVVDTRNATQDVGEGREKIVMA